MQSIELITTGRKTITNAETVSIIIAIIITILPAVIVSNWFK